MISFSCLCIENGAKNIADLRQLQITHFIIKLIINFRYYHRDNLLPVVIVWKIRSSNNRNPKPPSVFLLKNQFFSINFPHAKVLFSSYQFDSQWICRTYSKNIETQNIDDFGFVMYFQSLEMVGLFSIECSKLATFSSHPFGCCGQPLWE